MQLFLYAQRGSTATADLGLQSASEDEAEVDTAEGHEEEPLEDRPSSEEEEAKHDKPIVLRSFAALAKSQSQSHEASQTVAGAAPEDDSVTGM